MSLSFAVRALYPTMFLIVTAMGVCSVWLQGFKAWLQTIRDKEFLVEMRPRNLDSTAQQDLQNLQA